MRKLLIPLTLLFLLVAVSYAEVTYKEIFNQEVKSKTKFVADGKTFYAVAIDASKAKVNFPNNKSSTMMPGDCELQGEYHVCLLLIRQGDDKEFNITTQEWPIYIKIKIEKPQEDLEITRTIERKEITKGDITRVDVVMVNKGSINIKDATYTEVLSHNVEVTDTYNCEAKGDTITWKGDLSIGDEKRIIYSLKGVLAGSFTAAGNFTYGTNSKSLSDTITVKGVPLANYTNVMVVPSSVTLGDLITIKLDFSNRTEPGTVRYKVFMPEGFERYFNTVPFSKQLDYYLYSEYLPKDENRTIEFTFKAQKVGKFNITEQLGFKANNTEDTASYSQEIEVTVEDLRIQLDEPSYIVGEKATIVVTAINPNNGNTFRNIETSVESDVSVEAAKTIVTELRPHGMQKVLEITLIPNSSENVINLTVSYETEYKQVLIKKQLISLNPSGSVNNGQTQTTQGTSTDNSQSQQSTSPAESSSNQAQNIEVIREKFFNKSNPWLWVSSATIGLILASLAAVFIVKSRKEKTIEDKLDQLK